MKYHTQYIKLFYRYLSEKISPLIIETNISANAISISRIFIAIFAGVLLLIENYFFHLFSCFFLFLFSFFDALDGSIAAKTKKSNLGLWVDPLFDRLGLLIVFFCFSMYFFNQRSYILMIFPFLNLFFYMQRSLIGSDIRTKDKFIQFRRLYSPEKSNEEKTYTLKNIQDNEFNLKNIKSLLIHQFAPHTHNQIIYLIIFIMFQQISLGMILLFLINFAWYIYESYKVTKISIKLDKKIDD
ncbi:CDP-alcohol phosphatidyltransferase family protein [Candidatus Pelagibacter ubique]|nr:CDP-alcohol phosphatidyltransferase family protein [Candidatus Pelagibacter ubique]